MTLNWVSSYIATWILEIVFHCNIGMCMSMIRTNFVVNAMCIHCVDYYELSTRLLCFTTWYNTVHYTYVHTYGAAQFKLKSRNLQASHSHAYHRFLSMYVCKQIYHSPLHTSLIMSTNKSLNMSVSMCFSHVSFVLEMYTCINIKDGSEMVRLSIESRRTVNMLCSISYSVVEICPKREHYLLCNPL